MNILQELADTKAELIEAISAIDRETFNTIPFEGSWTAAQVSEHILKALGADLLYADTTPTDRQPDEKVKAIADLFLNFEIKMKSPDFILPDDKPKDKDVLLKGLEKIFDRLIHAAETLNLTEICTVFEVPGFGPFTRLEFLWFFNVHTKRHIRQLKNIAVALAKV
nr:DinB family protein [uncultured Mucilaginibacter sp.]